MFHTPDQPTAINVPLTVKVVDDEVVVDGVLPLEVSLTKDAALATGIELINAALGIDGAREFDLELGPIAADPCCQLKPTA